jgi:radical SAM superfamily enzyme with C-terminal helix-hairpin-helix motif
VATAGEREEKRKIEKTVLKSRADYQKVVRRINIK